MLNYLVFIAAALIGFLLRQLEIPIPYMLGGILAAFCCKTFYRPTFSGSLSLRNAMLGIAGYGIGAHCTSGTIMRMGAELPGVYGTYLGAEKKWKKEDLFNGTMFADGIAHVITVILISGAIVTVGAIVLHPAGLKIKAPAQMAAMLKPVLGTFANPVMGLALLGAAFSSLLGNTQRGVVLLNAGMDWSVGLESKRVRWTCVACILFGVIVCFAYSGSPTQLIFLANLATSIGTPTAGFFVTLLMWRKDINAGMRAPRLLQVSMTVCYIFATAITIFALANKLLK